MKDLCVSYLHQWFDMGFGLFNWYVGGASSYDGQYGTWGVTNDPSNVNTPKIAAIAQVATQN